MADWSEIVQQHGWVVWKTAHRLLCNEADVADCFQNTFVSALKLSRTEAIRHWPALLRRLATARALERLRQRRRESGRLTTLPEGSIVDARATEPEQAAEASELAEDLRKALVNLDERQAQVFCLACLEGLSYEQITEQLGLTVNHVGVLLNRARTSLRERLQAHAPMPAAKRLKREEQS